MESLWSNNGVFSQLSHDSYAIWLDELKNTRFCEGQDLNPEYFDLKAKVGWMNGLNLLYSYIEAFDDYWDF
jgi:hypothetical protein